MRRAALAALAALLLTTSPVSASAGIGWRQAPVGLPIYSNTDISQSVADWNASPYVELVPTGTSARGSYRYNGYTWPCGPKAGAIVVCISSAPYNITDLNYKGGYIKGAFVAIHDYGFVALVVTCHEIGHALGLGHSTDDPDSCLNQPSGSRHPSVQDFADLAAMYGP